MNDPTHSSGIPGYRLGPAAVAGGIAMLVGTTSSVALVFAAAEAAGATSVQAGSWILALFLGTGLASIALSSYFRQPVMMAWSTPGAALLATGLNGATLREAVGAFLLCNVLMLLTGLTGLFDRVVSRIPVPLGSALLAGVLGRFAVDGFASAKTAPAIVVGMFLSFLIVRRLAPKYTALAVFVAGITIAVVSGDVSFAGVRLSFADPEYIRPSFDIGVMLGVGVPLYLVTMAAQNVPGVAALRAHGYDVRASPAISVAGLAGVLFAPFGLYAINLAAITAAMVMGDDVHPDRAKRWPAAAFAGVFYASVGLIGGSVATVLSVLPRPVIIAGAGFALVPTIMNGLTTALSEPAHREAAIVAFLVTMSGVSLGGIGAAFWAIVAGALVLLAARVLPGRA